MPSIGDLAWALECIGTRGPCPGLVCSLVVFVESWERRARLIRFGVFPAVERRRAHAPSPSASRDGRLSLWLVGPVLGAVVWRLHEMGAHRPMCGWSCHYFYDSE